jgi:acetyl-CoA carboxylase biotin carboxyl carrier protein
LAERTADWLEAVRQVVAAVRASDVLQLELAAGDFSVRIRREPHTAWQTLAVAPAADEQREEHLHHVLAPLTGVFYRASTPTGRPYVEAGDWVEPDAVIGLVETMKIYNEVTTDCSGRVVRFLVDNGALVHSGEGLVLIEPGERSPAEAEPTTGLPA